jgi:ParB family chromosome partitioning protein
MKLRRVDPESIMIPEVRVTARFDEEKLAMFKESIKTTGQITPIICCQVDGNLVLVDGLHRLNEAIQNKVEKIDVAVTDGDMVDVLTKNIFLDHLRGKTPVSEMRKVIEALYKEYSISIEDIVKRTGLSQAYVEKLLIISELTPLVLEALDQEEIGVGHASALSRIKEPDRQEVVFQMCRANHWTVRQLEEFISQTLAIVQQRGEAPPVTERQAPATVGCTFCNEEYPPDQVASVIVCHSCQAIMYEAVAMARREAQQAAATVSSAKTATEMTTKTA